MENTLTRKVRKSGNGYVVGVPTEIMNDLSINGGDELEYIKEADGSYNIRKKKDEQQDFIDLIDDVMSDYDEALRGLVNR